MKMTVHKKELYVQSRGWIPTLYDISKEILEIVKVSGVVNSTCCIASYHTTCSVIIQECLHDIASFGFDF